MKLLKALAFLWGASCINHASHAAITSYGAGNISDTVNTASYKCVVDYGNWIWNAGVVAPGVSSCNPIGTPTPIYPRKVSPSTGYTTGTHRWWGSISFYGEMPIGDTSKAGYITPDPITSRISNVGARLMGMPNGLVASSTDVSYNMPSPFVEVYDGIAIGNSNYTSGLSAFLKDYSDGSVTVQWKSGSTAVMEATYVHGSPHVYFTALQGNLEIRTKASDSGEKGIFYQSGNTLGVWTNVAGIINNFLVTGHDTTTFSNTTSAKIGISNSSKRITVTWLPTTGTPSSSMISTFLNNATQRVDKVNVIYAVDRSTNKVTVTHQYLFSGSQVITMAGLLPMHWKNSNQAVTGFSTRSSRGVTRFALTSGFSYSIPFVGVLPYLPSGIGDYNLTQLQSLITEFMNAGSANWNTATDTYWAGKNYGKVAELAAIARSIGMTSQADTLINWLKGELQDWFSATTTGSLDTTKYFVYDSNWDTLLGLDESFGSHQQLNDHHFHYGYFVRAAAEICRVDVSWCSSSKYGPMVELLIRDYAADRNDTMFPYVRNFDPANGFSWASGHANFVRGNNNESTSEAANAYGAMVLYGQITGNNAITERGMYLHASTTATYWEYWNNYDRYRGLTGDYDNFHSNYPKMTTSIIWGNGHAFSTWFSGAYAHILGIQGLPLNPLVFHIGQRSDYLAQYFTLGMTESSNGKPSGLVNDQWRDVWWNIWAMTNGSAAATDLASYGFNYAPEAGETKAHTYHWVHTFKQLGALATGTGSLTANSPAAVAFNKSGVLTYIAYNFTNCASYVTFSDGMSLAVPAYSFRVKKSGETKDSSPTSCTSGSSSSKSSTASSVASSSKLSTSSATATSSSASSATGSSYGYTIMSSSSVTFFVNNSSWADVHYIINNGAQQNVRMTHNTDNSNTLTVSNIPAGAVVKYYFTYWQSSGAVDTTWAQFTMPTTASSSSKSSTATSSKSSGSSSSKKKK